jgi:hypothetical protein
MEEASVCRHLFVCGVRVVVSGTRALGSFPLLSEATGETASDIAWLANRGRFANHYRTRWVPKRIGRRLLEAPQRRIAAVQRVILRRLLDDAPLHPCAMAFRKGRGVLSHARIHLGRRWVVRLDLCDFFATIGVARVAGVFRKLGYDGELCRVLAELTTNAVILAGDATRDERLLYGPRHLPQGAPTSPALANLVAARLDRRLDALARSLRAACSGSPLATTRRRIARRASALM